MRTCIFPCVTHTLFRACGKKYTHHNQTKIKALTDWIDNQLPTGFQEAIKSSLPHYFLYPTTKKCWIDFAEEIKPFTIENALKLKAFHSINVIYTQDGYLKPFVCRMCHHQR